MKNKQTTTAVILILITLMQDADDGDGDDSDEDKYDAAKVQELLNDEELQDFNGDEEPDFDEEASAQLDLARAYIDMGEEAKPRRFCSN